MARPRKEQKTMGEASSSRLTRPTRTSLPRASKMNKPNYKVDLEEDDVSMVSITNKPNRKVELKKDVASKESKTDKPNCNVVLKEDDASTVNETKTDNQITPRFQLSSNGFEMIMNEISNGSNATKYGPKLVKATLLSYLIDMRVFVEFTEVQLQDFERTRSLKTGKLTRDGGICDCCDKTFTLTGFGVHGGESRFIMENIIIVERNFSLFNMLELIWSVLRRIETYNGNNKIENKDDPTDGNDDTCIICADGGNLICCSSCPSTYHQKCLNLQVALPDNWKCQYCCCKFCDDKHHKKRRYFTCEHCEKKYHYECYGGQAPDSYDLEKCCPLFCCIECNEVYDKLQKMLGVKQQINEDMSFTLLKADDLYIKYTKSVESIYNQITQNMKVVVATKLMEDSFEAIIDRFTEINVVRSVGLNCKSNFPRINFNGFYTIILESKEEIISAASIRINGTKIAEMPFIATSDNWRGKGMCKTFFGFIETTLKDLGVENLYIPSTSAMKEKWISNYGFKNASEENMKDMRSTRCIMFLRSKRLKKDLQERKDLNILPDLNLDPPEE